MRQKGFTLIELLVALAVGSVILIGSISAIYQIFNGTIRDRGHTIVMTDLNFAMARIKKDIMMTQNTDLIDGVSAGAVTLNWIDYYQYSEIDTGSTFYSCKYTLLGTELLRYFNDEVSVVGRNITSVGFVKNSNVITCNITAAETSVQSYSQTFSFSVQLLADTVW